MQAVQSRPLDLFKHVPYIKQVWGKWKLINVCVDKLNI